MSAGPGGVRTSVCPVCREPTTLLGRDDRIHLRCRSCGTEFVAVDPTAPPRPEHDDEPPERVLLEEGGVRVTESEFVAPGFSLAVERVLWCKVDVEPGRWVSPPEAFWMTAGAVGLMALAGLPAALALDSAAPAFPRLLGFAVAVAFVALGGWLVREGWQSRYYRLEQFRLILGTTGGEIRAFADADELFVRRIAEAVTEAVSAKEE